MNGPRSGPEPGGQYRDVRFTGLRVSGSLEGASFIDCVFEECDLRELRLHGSRLIDTDFLGCDLGLLDVTDSSFAGVTLENCHAVGVVWSRAEVSVERPLGVDAQNSVLNFCTYSGLALAKRRFEGCTIHEAFFERCDLRDASFRHSDLSGTTFTECDLRGVDLRTARNYAIDVRVNRVAGARAALPDAAALLAGLEVDLS